MERYFDTPIEQDEEDNFTQLSEHRQANRCIYEDE